MVGMIDRMEKWNSKKQESKSILLTV